MDSAFNLCHWFKDNIASFVIKYVLKDEMLS